MAMRPYDFKPSLLKGSQVAGVVSFSASNLPDWLRLAASTGRIFGFVYSGLDFGSSLMPLLLGLMMDIGSANYVFYACAGMLFLTIFTVVKVKKRSSTAF